MENIFYHKGKNVNVLIENAINKTKIRYMENGIIKEYTIRGFSSDYLAKSIRVDYMSTVKDSMENHIHSYISNYGASNERNFNYFYDMNVSGSTLGEAISKHCLNGMVHQQFGVTCFKESGEFFQPIVFEISTSGETAYESGTTVSDTGEYQIVRIGNGDGVIEIAYWEGEPTEFSIDGGVNWTTGTTFTGLSSGDYHLILKNVNAGVRAERLVNITQTIVDAPVDESVGTTDTTV
jgi:hypothetical protein